MKEMYQNARQSASDDPDVLSYWRTQSAESLDGRAQARVAECVRRISSISLAWRDAIRGDAAAASGLVLRLRKPLRKCTQVDLLMTVLLNAAFKDAGAAFVLSHVLRHAPLGRHERDRLAASWTDRGLHHRSRRMNRIRNGDSNSRVLVAFPNKSIL